MEMEMTSKYFLRIGLLLLISLCVAKGAFAAQATDFGDMVVHYNAVRTDFFNPQIARAYGIKRSKNKALLTITVLNKQLDLPAQPMKANVKAEAINLSNQRKLLSMREITDGGAIYYITEFPITNGETLDFSINVTPEGGRTQTVKFRQAFFTH